MNPKQRTYLRFLVTFLVLGGIGLAATVYLLIEERAPLPFQNVYTIKAEFPAADGVVAGLGQPVNVVGVKVGQVTGSTLVGGRAVVTLEIKRRQVPHVYQNATAQLQPITPLKDMQINLDPGGPPAPPLPAGGTLPVSQTHSPVALSDLLSTLDGDTRDYLSSLIASLGQGFGRRAADMRQMLRTMGPTVTQAGEIAHALAGRRAQLARLVHNVAVVTDAASRDRQLASLVVAGNRTLQALAAEDGPLRRSLTELPPTLNVARSTLIDLEPFADKLGPTTAALLPAIRRLPATLTALRPFLDEGTAALSSEIRPLVHDAQPLIGRLGPVVQALSGTTPRLSRAFQILTYTTNELAYNPNPGSKNQGFLFWLAWALHNFDSVISLGDAHGGIQRAQVMLNCAGAQSIPTIAHALGAFGLCPK
jgi:phospholipid/cholesterol/gamma-HCH transport system substrate-binding protein